MAEALALFQTFDLICSLTEMSRAWLVVWCRRSSVISGFDKLVGMMKRQVWKQKMQQFGLFCCKSFSPSFVIWDLRKVLQESHLLSSCIHVWLRIDQKSCMNLACRESLGVVAAFVLLCLHESFLKFAWSQLQFVWLEWWMLLLVWF